jgi:hypothetical protein
MAHQLPPELLTNAGFIRVFYLAGRALDVAAEEEGDETIDPATVAGGSGAGVGNRAPGGGDFLKALAETGDLGSRALPFQ